MLKLSKAYQFGTKFAANDEDELCEYENCGSPMRRRYPGGDPENGPAKMICNHGHSTCEECSTPINGTGFCEDCMEKGGDSFGSELDGPFGDEEEMSDELEEGPEPYDNPADDDEMDSAEDKKKYDARREAATPHANAAKDLFVKRRDLMNKINMLDDQLGKHREVLRALDPKMKHEAYADDKEFRAYLKPEKTLDMKKKKKKKSKKAELIEGLVKVAEVLDYAGDREGVSLIENMLYIFAKKNEEVPKYDVETVKKKVRDYPEVAPIAPSLSTRGCPDHHGTLMARIGDHTFQCQLDGKVYNWDNGFKDYNGNVYPGAVIKSIDVPNINERLFENREQAQAKNSK